MGKDKVLELFPEIAEVDELLQNTVFAVKHGFRNAYAPAAYTVQQSRDQNKNSVHSKNTSCAQKG